MLVSSCFNRSLDGFPKASMIQSAVRVAKEFMLYLNR